MHRLLHFMPSLGLSVLAVFFGLFLSWSIYFVNLYAERHGLVTVDHLIWNLIHRLGWWYWGIPVALSVVGLLYCATLDRPGTRWSFLTRLIALIAFDLYTFSPAVPSLGPIAAVLTVGAFVMFIRQQSLLCRAKRPKVDLTGAPFVVRLYNFLSTDVHTVTGGHYE